MEDNNEMELMRQRMRRQSDALKQMTADLQWLITQPAGSLQWTGTQRDLVEMIHLVCTQRTLVDAQGRPHTQQGLARLAFAAIGRHVPVSLPRIVSLVQNRQTPQLSMLYRYVLLAGDGKIINHFIKTKKV